MQSKDLPGVQWVPSNGTVGYSFIEHNCANCERDANERCSILAASFWGEAIEWRSTDEGQFCVAFVERGQPLPEPRCDRTIDMFKGE